MTKEEAIEVFESILEEATRQKYLVCYVTIENCDALRMVIEALKRDDPEVEFQKRFERSTFCGYTSKELLMFADACRRQNISEAEMRAFCNNTETAFYYVLAKWKEKMMADIARTLS